MGSADNGCNTKVRACTSFCKSYQLIQYFNYRKKEFCKKNFFNFYTHEKSLKYFYTEVAVFF